MISFVISLVALLLGYVLYGRLIEKIFKPIPYKKVPAYAKQDGVDYVPMPTWKVLMIQFLNIAGTGPIFGAIMGAKFGPSSYLWIVFGCIFAGAVHDYLSGMLSVRKGGASLPDLIAIYSGRKKKTVMLVLTLMLLLLVGAVFVYSPAVILKDIAGDGSDMAFMIWAGIIFVYYVIATLLPVDKVIGKIYPLFAFALIFMAVSLMVVLIVKWPSIPEFWDGLGNMGPSVGVDGQSIFPCLFITVACGAISGFHATQSPLMAKCMENESEGRKIFFGSMIMEGAVALVWAAVGSYFFFSGGAAEVGSNLSAAAPVVVTAVSKKWLGLLGGILALFGVVAAPITSGDTALRSARLIVAEIFNFDQGPSRNRLVISIPIFCIVLLLLWFNVSDADGFNTIWQYFGWANQTLACFTLWTLTSFLTTKKIGAGVNITAVPACFMTAVCVTYIATSKIGLNLPMSWTPYIAAVTVIVSILIFRHWADNYEKRGLFYKKQ